MLSAETEDYLKAIYEEHHQEGSPVATSRLAEVLDVTAPTVTSMVEKLADRDLVDREKYKGVTLTPEGERVALEVIRHHRLLETYLAEHLGYDWVEVHDEADRLEHHISEEFERRVAAVLGDPDVDPHGDPIPNGALDPVDELPGTRLSDHEENETVVVNRVRDRDPEELAHLDEVGVTPGTHVTITAVAPIGLFTLELEDGSEVSLPAEIANSIRVTLPEDGSRDGVEA